MVGISGWDANDNARTLHIAIYPPEDIGRNQTLRFTVGGIAATASSGDGIDANGGIVNLTINATNSATITRSAARNGHVAVDWTHGGNVYHGYIDYVPAATGGEASADTTLLLTTTADLSRNVWTAVSWDVAPTAENAAILLFEYNVRPTSSTTYSTAMSWQTWNNLLATAGRLTNNHKRYNLNISAGAFYTSRTSDGELLISTAIDNDDPMPLTIRGLSPRGPKGDKGDPGDPVAPTKQLMTTGGTLPTGTYELHAVAHRDVSGRRYFYSHTLPIEVLDVGRASRMYLGEANPASPRDTNDVYVDLALSSDRTLTFARGGLTGWTITIYAVRAA